MSSENKPQLLNSCKEILESLVTDSKSKSDMDVFLRLYSQFLEEPATINWNSWSLPDESNFIDSKELPNLEESEAKKLLNRLAVVRLNGGLGTTMGCNGPKSLITVKNEKNFLEIALEQVNFLNEKYNYELLKKGKSVLFVSNIDNTGATVDPRFIKILTEEKREYMMEVTDKTQADIKGGTLVKIDGRMMHLEMPQVPPEGIDEFCSTKTFKIFNTNNIWVDLEAIRPKLGEIKREIIANKKTLSTGEKVIQLETSIGGAIRNFPNACGLKVSRSRFLPVKRTQDLLLVSSDVFEFDNESNVTLVKTRKAAPLISLSKEFDNLEEFQRRFKKIPSLKNADSLKIKGDVWFGENVVLKGKVEIEAKEGDTVVIKDGEVIDGN
ncbi:hypothetical protein FO519_007137 [Halicephalobus sp. NKZ332]|nr:hypothetical protein FO519_007137 [Halicephalobus sp. NKZ332]